MIPRRALFDVKMQLMAESEEVTEAGLGASDIETHVYEGGFKSWEGAFDLAQLTLQTSSIQADLAATVVELGCGQALPSLVLLQRALRSSSGQTFVLADYNESVLRLVTLPNVLLTWALERAPQVFDTIPTIDSNCQLMHGDGDIEITDDLKAHFLGDLAQSGVQLQLLSGPWSEDLTRQISLHDGASVLVLGAETIYSPASLAAFTDALLQLLQRAKKSKGLVASKRVYFGVGGGVDDFRHRAAQRGAVVQEIKDSGIAACDGTLSRGVGRCLLRVRLQ